jgi:hypothetical protein
VVIDFLYAFYVLMTSVVLQDGLILRCYIIAFVYYEDTIFSDFVQEIIFHTNELNVSNT